jgi:ATP-dependent Clp protease ATP-binding subunit ClpA
MTDSADREVRLNNTIIIFSATLSSDESRELSRKSSGMGFGKEEQCDSTTEAVTKILPPDLVASTDSMIMFNEPDDKMLRSIYNANVERYLGMYRKVDIDLKKLEERVMSGSKNGHDVVTGLQSHVPKMIFEQFNL